MARGTLRSLRVHEGSLVDDPANQHAKVVLTKRAPGARGDPKMPAIHKDGQPATPAVPPSPDGENPTSPATPDKAAPGAPPPAAAAGGAPAADPLAGLSDQQKQAVASMLAAQKQSYEAKIAALTGGGGAPPAQPPAAGGAPPAMPPGHMPAKSSDGDGNGDEEGSYEKALAKAFGGELPASVRKQIERDRAERAELRKSLEIEKSARLDREYLEKARGRDYQGLPGTHAEIAKALRAIDGYVPAEIAKGLHSMLKAAAARAKAGEEVLGKAFGVGPGGTEGDGNGPWDKIQKGAASLVEKSAGKLTKDVALSKFLESDEGKALYREYQQERSALLGRPTA
jgi:hypothetical protein